MILYRYFIREYMKFVGGTLLLSTFLFILFDFIHKTTGYIERYKPSFSALARLYFFQTPMNLVQALPIASLIASVIVMVIFSRSNEVTAMRASGMGPVRIALPLAMSGLFLSLLSLLMGEVIIPFAANKYHYVAEVEIEGESSVEIAKGARWVRQGSLLVHFADYDPYKQILSGIRLVKLSDQFGPSEIIEANEGEYIPESDQWRLQDLLVIRYKPNGTMDYMLREDTATLALPVEPKKLKKERRLPNEMSLAELSHFIDRGEQLGTDIMAYKVDYHVKFAYSFAALVLSLMGLNFGYRSERKTEAAKSVLLALGIGLSYWFILNSLVALGKRGGVPPLVAGWTANGLLLALSGMMVYDKTKIS